MAGGIEIPEKGDGRLIAVNEYRRVVTNGVARYEYDGNIIGQETLISKSQIIKARAIGTGYIVTEPKKPEAVKIFQLSLINGTRLIIDLKTIENLQMNYSILTDEVSVYIDQRSNGVTKPVRAKETQLINSEVAVVSITSGGGVYYESVNARPTLLYIATLIDGVKLRVDSRGKDTLNGAR